MDRNLLRDELIRDEGLRLKVYKDSVGLYTIGVGHLLGAEARMLDITKGEAMALLEADIDSAYDLALRLAPGAFNVDCDSRERALVNMSFNLGGRLGGFRKFLAAVNSHNWAVAAEEMLDSKWAVQVGARARRLRDMLYV